MVQTYSRLVSGLLGFIFMMAPLDLSQHQIDIFIGFLDWIPAVNVCLSAATTLISTLIITFRILRLEWHGNRRREGATRKNKKSTVYTAMEIVVESSALYSVTAILYVSFGMDPNPIGDSDQQSWSILINPFFFAIVVCS
jgi:hypothetical protein